MAWLVAKSVLRLVGTEATCGLARAHGVSSLSMNHALLDEATLATVRAHGLSIGTFGIVEAAGGRSGAGPGGRSSDERPP